MSHTHTQGQNRSVNPHCNSVETVQPCTAQAANASYPPQYTARHRPAMTSVHHGPYRGNTTAQLNLSIQRTRSRQAQHATDIVVA